MQNLPVPLSSGGEKQKLKKSYPEQNCGVDFHDYFFKTCKYV